MMRRTRRRPAAASRAIATGISGSAFFALVATLATAARNEHLAAATPAPTTLSRLPPETVATTAGPPPTRVVREVHRTIYLDEFGNPVAEPTAVTTPPSPDLSLTDPLALLPPETPVPPVSTASPSPAGPASGPTVSAPSAPDDTSPSDVPQVTEPNPPADTEPTATEPPAPPETQPPPPTVPPCQGTNCRPGGTPSP